MLIVLLLGGAAWWSLFDTNGQRAGLVREGPGNTVDVYDAQSRRVGWGRRGADGSLELFDTKGNRIGTVTRDGRTLRLERPLKK